jgi:hypothetical protein
MRNHIIISALISVLFISCKKEGLYTQTMNQTLNNENSVVLRQGTLMATSGITAQGTAEIRRSGELTYVQLTNFSISNGPDLKVYLSKSDSPTDFVNLGSLQYSGGIYMIPEDILDTDYDYVLIHCQQYNHLFAIANLQ